MMITLQLKHKVMLLVNALLGLFYVVSSYWIWAELDKWVKWNIATNWTPILIYPYRIPNTSQIQMPISPLWNVPFILFCVIFGVNVYFIVSLQRSKENKQTPS
jgi:hypothetical protein